MKKDIVIGGVKIKAGETKDINLFIAKLYDFTDAYMPVKVIRGKQDGPRLFVSAVVVAFADKKLTKAEIDVIVKEAKDVPLAVKALIKKE